MRVENTGYITAPSLFYPGYLRRIGFEVVLAGIVPDEPEAIRNLTESGLDSCDLVITTGGASIGDYDYALSTAESVGAEVLFWKCGMKPGGAILASVRKRISFC